MKHVGPLDLNGHPSVGLWVLELEPVHLAERSSRDGLSVFVEVEEDIADTFAEKYQQNNVLDNHNQLMFLIESNSTFNTLTPAKTGVNGH